MFLTMRDKFSLEIVSAYGMELPSWLKLVVRLVWSFLSQYLHLLLDFTVIEDLVLTDAIHWVSNGKVGFLTTSLLRCLLSSGWLWWITPYFITRYLIWYGALSSTGLTCICWSVVVLQLVSSKIFGLDQLFFVNFR